MGGIIPPHGFSIIELLITMVIVLALVSILMKTHHRRESSPESAPVERQMRDDVEGASDISVTVLSPTQFAGTNKNGSFRYVLSGAIPNQSLSREATDTPAVVAQHVAFFRVTAYDADDHFLMDNPGKEQLQSIRKLRVELGTHAEKEAPEFFVNDRSQGVDLDGDLTNGTAKIATRTFGLILKQR